ncbi:MAG: response regulator [Flavobacteriales bacterium]|nr:response regulator [Flavobacteriales bacterium]
MRYWLIACACMASAWGATAQPDPSRWTVRHYGVEHGLSQTSAASIVQDPDGFIWIGTEDGINRFDGRVFKVYRHIQLDGESVKSARVHSLFITRSGSLVAGSDEHGVLLYDQRADRFTSVPFPANSTAPGSSYILRSIADLSNGRLLLGTFWGLFIYDPAAGTVINAHDRIPAVHPNAPISGLARTTKGVMVSTMDHESERPLLLQISDDLTRVEPIDVAGFPMGNELGIALWQHGDSVLRFKIGERIWVSRIDPIEPMEVAVPGSVMVEALPLDGFILAATLDGVHHIDADGSPTRIPLPDMRSPNAQMQITSLVQVSDGSVWVGSYQGVFVLDRVSAKFKHYGFGGDADLPLSAPKVRGLLKDSRGRLWVGTQNGLDLVEADRKTVRNLLLDAPSTIGYTCRSIVEDAIGGIWAATDHSGIYRFGATGEPPVRFDADSACNGTFSLLLEHDGMLHTGCNLNLIDTRTFQAVPHTKEPSTSVIHGYEKAFCQYRTQDGTHVHGTMNRGLFTFRRDPSSKRVTDLRHFPMNPSDSTALANGFITCIREDSNGMIWLGTYGGGLHAFDHTSGRFTRLTMEDGLPNDVVYALEIDRHDRIWLSSNAGLSCYEPKSGKITNYGLSDRIQSLEFNSGSSHQAQDGELFFGGINGFNAFYPDSIKFNPYLPKLAFTGLVIGHTEMEIGKPGSPLHRNITYQDTIELNHEQNDLTIRFAALSFISPEKNRFAYMLKGYKDEWVHLGTQNRVSFTNLDPGGYELLVKAANNDGIWNDAPSSLWITIAPPWHRTNLATALFIVAGAFFAFGVGWILLSRVRLRYQVAREHEEAERAKAEDERKTRFFINVAHDLRTPLTLIKQRVERLAANPAERMDEPTTQVLRRSVDKLTGRITALLETARQEHDHIALDASPMSVNELLHVVVADFRPMAADRRIELRFIPADGDPVIALDRPKVTMALENLLGNAFKFTPDDGAITVKAERCTMDGSEALRISVADTGSGIAPEDHQRIFNLYERSDGPQAAGQVGAGVGLFHVRRIMEMHGGRWRLESALGQGTTVHLEFPFTTEPGASNGPVLVDPMLHEEQEEAVEPEPVADEYGTAKPIALVIEDDRDLNAAIADLLRSEFRVHRAHNGEEGLARAFELVPDLVITDVMMPMKDGFEVCRELKSDIRTSHVPVIVLTAITDMEERIRGLHEGADDFLPKPYEPRELLARARNAIARTEKVRAHNQASLGLKPDRPLDPLRDMDRIWVEKVQALIEARYGSPELNANQLGVLLNMDRSNVTRKLNALIGRAPGELIREKRMTVARELLEKGECTVTEAMRRVGYEDPSTFSNAFKAYWEKPPSHFLLRK